MEYVLYQILKPINFKNSVNRKMNLGTFSQVVLKITAIIKFDDNT